MFGFELQRYTGAVEHVSDRKATPFSPSLLMSPGQFIMMSPSSYMMSDMGANYLSPLHEAGGVPQQQEAVPQLRGAAMPPVPLWADQTKPPEPQVPMPARFRTVGAKFTTVL